MKKKIELDLGEEITPKDSVAPVYLKPLTAEEEADREELYKEQLEREKTEQARKDARVNAVKKLSKLGLTDKEIEAMIGGY